jgi:antitoxin HicB
VKYHFRIHKEGKGYWAECIEIDWANTQGDSLEELQANMKEVLELCLDERDDKSTFIPPMPIASIKGRNIVEVSPDPKIALAALIRKERIEARLSQREVANRMGIRHVSQYQKLESGKTANAELGTLAKLKKVFPSFSVDAVLD